LKANHCIDSIPSIYLKIPSKTMIGLSKKGRALKELAIVLPIDCFNLLTNSFANSFGCPVKSVILRCGTEILSSLMEGMSSMYSE
jgi:hypothetical protein